MIKKIFAVIITIIICFSISNESITTFAVSHKWSSWTTIDEPTCSDKGLRRRTCNAEALPHWEEEEIPPLGHDYKETVTEPTCTEKGKRISTCTRCGDSHEEIFGEPTGHRYVAEITLPPTYDKEGVRTYTCSLCGDSYTETVAKVTQHTHDYIIKSERNPTCEKNGEITKECIICGKILKETIPATGHNWGEWQTIKRQNLTEKGLRRRVCTHDSTHVEEEVIPRGITLEVTPAMIGINISSVLLVVCSAFTLFWQIGIILWERRERKKNAELMKKGGEEQWRF